MSDDCPEVKDDSGVETATEGTVGKHFVNHKLSYRSQEAQELYDAIDAIKDPDSDRARKITPRVPGAIIQCLPLKVYSLKDRIRAWQVKPEVLAENPQLFRVGRVVKSGDLWDDQGEPTEEDFEK
ncbi:hypothetical protein EW146_g8368 [Bondarzewia mesenterica]|uniref:Uncharacterized protein n=1 Tax=Bondarzewia mesenterica TaxID=1095465 RepID=A0A4S4LEZ0_9AGAM|nr:hypothetical protein EW146_g8368 [Bondarzewia mesenterica]